MKNTKQLVTLLYIQLYISSLILFILCRLVGTNERRQSWYSLLFYEHLTIPGITIQKRSIKRKKLQINNNDNDNDNDNENVFI